MVAIYNRTPIIWYPYYKWTSLALVCPLTTFFPYQQFLSNLVDDLHLTRESKRKSLQGQIPRDQHKKIARRFWWAEIFSSSLDAVLGRKWAKLFYSWNTYGLLPGRFISTLLPGLTPQGSFLGFFSIFLVFQIFFSIFPSMT